MVPVLPISNIREALRRPVSKRALPVIRVFVSSTFSDLKHERNALHAQVWPELERYCQQRGFTFQAIDLRWGVPAEAGLDHRTMRICFEELRRSQETSPEPNFLILLGNRYGWRPLPEVISVEEFGDLKKAAELIQTEPPDLTRKPTASHVELLTKAVSVLEDWYLLDKNAKPFGDQTLLGEYVLRTRKTPLRGEPVKESSRDREGAVVFDDLRPLPDGRGSFFQTLGVDYGKYLDADAKQSVVHRTPES